MKLRNLINIGCISISLCLYFGVNPTQVFASSGLTPITSISDLSSQVSEVEKGYEFSDLKGQTFKTDRLTITPTTTADLDILSEYLLDKDVTEYLDPSPAVKKGFETKEAALNFLKGELESRSDNTLLFTVKLSKAEGDIPALTPIGKIDLTLYGKSIVAVGYWLGKDFQGKGYMSEASFELCNKAFLSSDIKTLYIACDVKNKSSSNLARKICDYIEKVNEDMHLSRDVEQSNARDIIDGEEISFDFFQFTLQKQDIDQESSLDYDEPNTEIKSEDASDNENISTDSEIKTEDEIFKDRIAPETKNLKTILICVLVIVLIASGGIIGYKISMKRK